jgi:hypothetical protein
MITVKNDSLLGKLSMAPFKFYLIETTLKKQMTFVTYPDIYLDEFLKGLRFRKAKEIRDGVFYESGLGDVWVIVTQHVERVNEIATRNGIASLS